MSFQNKYLKYKNKYLDLKNKNQFGGSTTLPSEVCNKIIRINENILYGAKKIKYKKKVERKIEYDYDYDTVYFIFEKLTAINYNFWKDFIDDQDVNTRRGTQTSSGKDIDVEDGVSSFRISLELYNDNKSNDIWITYATRINPTLNIERYRNDIEMVCTIFANSSSPITTHIGILRNYIYFVDPYSDAHIELAIELHGFAALASKFIYSQVEYMVTKPNRMIRNIMKKKLEQTEKMWVGSYTERLDSINFLKLISLFKIDAKSVEDVEDVKSVEDVEDVKIIIEKDVLDFFCKYINNSFGVNKYLRLEIKQVCDNKVQFIKENNENLFEIHLNKSIYLEIKDVLKLKINGQQEKLKNYIPLDLYTELPLNNYNDTRWSIIKNGSVTNFTPPVWFDKIIGHRHLLLYLETVITEIDELGKSWSLCK